MDNSRKNNKEKQAKDNGPAFAASKKVILPRRQFKNNELVSVYITDLGKGGVGIGRVEGYTLFVKDALIDDLVMARITKPSSSTGRPRIMMISQLGGIVPWS